MGESLFIEIELQCKDCGSFETYIESFGILTTEDGEIIPGIACFYVVCESCGGINAVELNFVSGNEEEISVPDLEQDHFSLFEAFDTYKANKAFWN